MHLLFTLRVHHRGDLALAFIGDREGGRVENGGYLKGQGDSFLHQGYVLTSFGLLNFSLGYTKLVTPKGKNQHTLRKL